MPRRSPARPSFYQRMPTSWQWGLPATIGVLAIAALIVFVRHQSSSAPGIAVVSSARLRVEEKQAAEVMRQQEQPHLARLVAGVSATAGLEAAVRSWVDQQTKSGALNGPVTGVKCTHSAGSTPTRVTLNCTVVAGQVNYTFVGVVEPSIKTVTYCQKIDYAPVYGEKTIPVPSACT